MMKPDINLQDHDHEPTDEQLAQIMQAVTLEANSKADHAYQALRTLVRQAITPEREMLEPLRSQYHAPTMTIIAGPNGSGKSSFGNKLLEHGWVGKDAYINPDNLAQDVFGDWNSPSAALKAAVLAEQQRERFLQMRQSFVFESVFSAPDKYEVVRRAKLAGYFVRLFVICTSHPSINAARVAKRVMEGGHDVPIPKILSRYPKAIANCAAAAAIANRAYAFDNSVDGQDARLMLRTINGRIANMHVPLPDWVQTIAEGLSNPREPV
jgi:predicted ABC-type ATPase